METGTTLDAPAGRPARPAPHGDRSWAERRRTAWHVARAGIALGWLLFTAAVILTGERTAPLDSLVGAAADGDVEEVHLEGMPLTAGSGVEHMVVRWREGRLHYVASIIEARPRRAGLRATGSSDPRPVVTRDAGAYLEARLHGVRLTRDPGPGTSYSNGLGPWHVADEVMDGAVVLWVLTLFLLIGGPHPWRATRWAWFWGLFLVPTIGVPAFLLLSGPVPGTPTPRRGARVLTGGWAFLLAVALDGVVGS